jgi:hypothetical protein
MKKWTIFALALMAGAVSANAGISLRLTGGPTYLFVADYNDPLQGTSEYYRAVSDSLTGSTRPVHWGWSYGGEIIASIGGGLSLGLGAGYLRASTETKLSYQSLGFSTDETYRPEITAIPITVSLHYAYPLGRTLRLDFFGGAVYCLTTFRHEFRLASDFFSYSQTQDFTSRTGAFGFRGGLGLEIVLASALALVVQAEGRYAVISEVSGDLTNQENLLTGNRRDTVRNAFLWIYDQADAGTRYVRMAFSQSQPSGPSVANVRKGQIDLSGFSASAGIRLYF